MRSNRLFWKVAAAGALVLIAVSVAGFVLVVRASLAAEPAVSQLPTAIAVGPTPVEATGPYPGDLALDFRLAGLDQQEVRLSDHRGHKVLLNFFTTWCEPCRLEMPGVQAQYEAHQAHDWVVIGVDILEPRWDVDAFRDEFGLTFPIALDATGDISRRYEIRGTPTNIVIDEQGYIVERRLGYMSEDELEQMLEAVP